MFFLTCTKITVEIIFNDTLCRLTTKSLSLYVQCLLIILQQEYKIESNPITCEKIRSYFATLRCSRVQTNAIRGSVATLRREPTTTTVINVRTN